MTLRVNLSQFLGEIEAYLKGKSKLMFRVSVKRNSKLTLKGNLS